MGKSKEELNRDIHALTWLHHETECALR